MRMIHLPGADRVSDPVHGEATAGSDGVFDLPHTFAEHLLRTAAGTWRTEADHIALLARESRDELRDPSVALNVLADLRVRVESLEAEAAARRGGNAPTATPPADPPTPDAPRDGKPPEPTDPEPDAPAEAPTATPPADARAKAAKKAAAGKRVDTPPATRPA